MVDDEHEHEYRQVDSVSNSEIGSTTIVERCEICDNKRVRMIDDRQSGLGEFDS